METKASSDPAPRQLPETAEDLSVEIPTPIGLDKSGRIIGLCPEVPEGVEAEGVHCWKFEPLPGQESAHDFLLLIFLVELGPLNLLNAVIPLDDGGVKHLVKFEEIRHSVESAFIQKIKLSHGNFGVFSIGKLKAKTYYAEIERLFASQRCLVKRFNARGEPAGDYTEISPRDFPPFPEGTKSLSGGAKLMGLQSTLPPEEAMRLVGADDYHQGLTLHFSEWEEQGPDLIVNDAEGIGLDVARPGPRRGSSGMTAADDIGHLTDEEIGLGFVSIGCEAADTLDSAGAPAPRKKRQPGIHIEFVRHPGNPAHVAALFWFKPPGGRPRFLFGDWCTQISFHKFLERVIERKKKSFLGSKKKITVIRKELLADGVLCKPIP